MKRIIENIRCYSDISDATLSELASRLSPVHFAKRTLMVEEGKRAGAAFFIEHGITRSYWMVDGEEITTSFSAEGTVVFSMDEIYDDRPSEEFVEALEDLDGYSITAAELRVLVHDNIELARWWSAIHQREYRRLHQSHKERLTLPAQERYEAFRRQFPDVCRRVRRGLIASYLGISPSTLSRISGI